MSDENFVSDVVDDLKKQGLFDRFRKECLADVDTKPAYQNLQLRVKEAVGKYLHSLKWKSDLNKNQLRENLRRHLNELPMLTNGIDRVVEQVVKPKVMKSLKPQVDGVICEHMNIAYEQWLSDQNDAQKKKLAKVEEVVVPPPVLPSLCTSAAVPPSFPPVMTVPLVPPISAPPPIINDLQLPPPPPPSFEEPNDSTSSPHNPPPPPPPLPSDASEDELSVPAPPPDVYRSVSSPPPLPPDDDDDENNAAIPPEVEETGMAEEGCNQEDDAFEDVESSHIIKTCPDVEDPPDESNTASDRACDSISGNLCGKTSAAGRSSDGRSPNDSFSNENSFPFLNSEVLNDDGVSKEYRFAWNNFNESDLSNISVSSVHTSDLSNFEEDEDLDASLNDPDQNLGKIHSKDGDVSKDSDSKQSTSVRHSLNESVHGSLDTSNASFNSSGRRRTKKEELKERKMEEKKELKRQRVLNRRYCSEDFMSIFSDKQNLQQKQEAREEAKTKDICHSESKIDGDEDIKLDGEANASDLENAYSPYSNISEASSESVVVLGVEPAKPKKGKKAKSRKRSRSSDGNRRKKKRRRHKSSRRSSRHCSGGDDEIEDMSCYLKQDGIRTKSSVHEFDNNSSKGYPEEELADDYYMDEFCSDATKKKLKKSVDRV